MRATTCMHQWVVYLGLTRCSDTWTRSDDILLLPCCPQPYTHPPITSDHSSTPDITSMMHSHLSPPSSKAARCNLHLPCFINLALHPAPRHRPCPFTQRRLSPPMMNTDLGLGCCSRDGCTSSSWYTSSSDSELCILPSSNSTFTGHGWRRGQGLTSSAEGVVVHALRAV